MTPHHRTILCPLGQAVTTRPPCFVSPLGQRAALCHLTNGCRASKFTCLFFFSSHSICQNHIILMYVQTIRSLYEKGADWRSYDEAFRSLRQANNWGWESVCWYLWMNASESRPAATSSVTPFRSKGKASWGKAKWPSTKTCFAFDRGEVCNAATCRYTHKCRRCGGPHSAARCYRQRTQPNPARPSSATGIPATQSSTASSRPAVFRR